jgi:hypothetical protein
MKVMFHEFANSEVTEDIPQTLSQLTVNQTVLCHLGSLNWSSILWPPLVKALGYVRS